MDGARKERRGFASMSREKQREIASKGGRAAHEKGTAHEWTPDEGCLSVPGYWAKVKRNARVTVKARDAKGKEIRLVGEGLLGQALQHELDHLNGMLYVDRLDSLDELQRSARERERRGPPEAGDPVE